MRDYYADVSKIFTVVKNFGVGWKVFEGKSQLHLFDQNFVKTVLL